MKMMTSLTAFAIILLTTGCASSMKQSSYQTGAVQQKMRVTLATVLDVREVDIEVKASGAGAAAGTAAGAVMAGNNSGSNRGIVSGIAGALVGGIAGTLADKAANAKKGQEIVYRIDGTNETQALVQEVDDDPIRVGDRVRLMEGSFSARLVKLGKTVMQ